MISSAEFNGPVLLMREQIHGTLTRREIQIFKRLIDAALPLSSDALSRPRFRPAPFSPISI